MHDTLHLLFLSRRNTDIVQEKEKPAQENHKMKQIIITQQETQVKKTINLKFNNFPKKISCRESLVLHPGLLTPVLYATVLIQQQTPLLYSTTKTRDTLWQKRCETLDSLDFVCLRTSKSLPGRLKILLLHWFCILVVISSFKPGLNYNSKQQKVTRLRESCYPCAWCLLDSHDIDQHPMIDFAFLFLPFFMSVLSSPLFLSCLSLCLHHHPWSWSAQILSMSTSFFFMRHACVDKKSKHILQVSQWLFCMEELKRDEDWRKEGNDKKRVSKGKRGRKQKRPDLH